MQLMPEITQRRHALRAIAAITAMTAWPLPGCGKASTSISKPWSPWAPDMPKAPDMPPGKAYALYLAWKQFVGPVRKQVFTGFELQTDGSFKAIHGAAEFAYTFETKTLMVMRQLLDGEGSMVREEWPGVVADRRLAVKEPYTLGGGQFYINPHPWLTNFDKANSPNMNSYNLKRDFTNAGIPNERFVLDVRWLMFWGYYWFPLFGKVKGMEESGSRRAFQTFEYQERTRPALEKWARSLLAKGEPPDL
ncbi:hypothetical protein [Comamonas sp. 4034]|uniref:hypothetical protein n=1 Tax=Comamonas sp. 4034 TaxID=3156455 RepID=UPI003D1924DE